MKTNDNFRLWDWVFDDPFFSYEFIKKQDSKKSEGDSNRTPRKYQYNVEKLGQKLLDNHFSIFKSNHSIKKLEDKYIVEALIPGRKKEDINVSVQDNGLYGSELIISSEAIDSSDSQFKSKKYNLQLNFNEKIASDKVKAEYEAGILTLILPFKKDGKSKKIIKIT